MCRRGNKFYLLQDRRQGFHFSTFTLKAGNTFTGECFFFTIKPSFLLFFPSFCTFQGQQNVGKLWHMMTTCPQSKETRAKVAEEGQRREARGDTRNCYWGAKRQRKRERRRPSGGEGDTCWGATRIDIIVYNPSGDSLQAEEKGQRIEGDRSTSRKTRRGEAGRGGARRGRHACSTERLFSNRKPKTTAIITRKGQSDRASVYRLSKHWTFKLITGATHTV